ncbi:lanthionine synthetase LanC family protein [Mucilaginibacter endophyticus]|uniref:lanthionine synthetase LanC family protein n=1 Tax=Mucilaginibacter endophyticus TaxID=2675003 RepID=UPI000E0CC48D|nr:lanthionine synthetase LanC family protein [Mucilaginibacter endophyticus]
MDENLRNQVLRESEKITAYFLGLDQIPESIDVYTGMSGNLLFMAQHFLWSRQQVYLDKVSEYLAFSMERIEASLNRNFDFSLALSGWGWVLSYLGRQEIAEVTEILADIDGYLKPAMTWLLRFGNYDQLNGALKIGRYFLARGNPGPVAEIIDYLDHVKVSRGDQVMWKRQKEGESRAYYDLGLAHGAAGLLRFFSSCVKSKIREADCRRLMDGTVRFILANVRDPRLTGSCFPNMISVDDYHAGRQMQTRSRLAWCYGDLGIWYTLYSAAVLLGDTGLEARALEGLEKLTTRRSPDNTMVVDAGFCHGSSGISFIFNKVWDATGQPVFREARDFWLRDTLRYGSDKYEFLVGNFAKRYFKPCDTLLEGLIGVGLSYGSFLNPQQEGWDQCLLLS